MSEHAKASQVLPADFAALLQTMRENRDPRYQATLHVARLNGWTCQSMAQALGVSRQAIEQAASRASFRASDQLPEVPLPPRKPEPEPKPVRPRLLVGDELASQLREMQRVAATVNGATPADAPERAVSIRFTAMLQALIEQGVTLYHLAQVLGVQYNALTSRLARHGYRAPSPSLAGQRYLGRPAERTTGTQSHCKRGHELSGDNLYVVPKTGARVCKACGRLRSAAYYARKQSGMQVGEPR